LRKALNVLQSCASLSKTVNEELVYEVASYAQPSDLKKALTLALQGSFSQARSLMIDVILKYGLSGLDAVRQIESIVMGMELPDTVKVRLLDRIGEYEFRMVEGADEFLQIDALLAQFYIIGRGA
jgi:replication factor C small subunit